MHDLTLLAMQENQVARQMQREMVALWDMGGWGGWEGRLHLGVRPILVALMVGEEVVVRMGLVRGGGVGGVGSGSGALPLGTPGVPGAPGVPANSTPESQGGLFLGGVGGVGGGVYSGGNNGDDDDDDDDDDDEEMIAFVGESRQ